MASWNEMGFGDFSVTELSHATVKLSDGVDLGMKVWLPCKSSEISQKFPYFGKNEFQQWIDEIYVSKSIPELGVFPTILEYLPYPKDSQTLLRDRNRLPWFCSHGYIVLRVDFRGTGSSSGFIYDEYEEQEIQDCLEVLEWVSSQSWSNKAIGMYGKSWGGFNGLQTAYKQPPALKAVISLYSTDDRYNDDMHYQGGTIIGNGMMSWAAFMFAINARPPHPRYFSSVEEWKVFWLTRLQTTGKSFLSSWLTHQHPKDPFWQHGSICTDYSKVKCPVLVIGGHVDSYTNAAFRMAAHLNQSSRSIIGPWSHEWPDVSYFGPNIDYLNVCLQWWNYHLKGDDSLGDVTMWPRLSLYCRDSFKSNDVNAFTGKWFDLPNWNSLLQEYQLFRFEDHSTLSSDNLQCLYFGSSMNLTSSKSSTPVKAVELHPHVLQGSKSGDWLIVNDGFQGDQTQANKYSACWKSSKLDNSVLMTGLSKLYVCLSSMKPGKYNIQARICDQFPDGESTLVTKGCLNLCLSDVNESDGWVPTYSGERKIFCVDINGTGHSFDPGHEILIAISPTYFPSMYPSVDNKGLQLHPEDTYLCFQTVKNINASSRFSPPKPLLHLPSNRLSPNLSSSTSDVLPGKQFKITKKCNSGLVHYPTLGFEEEKNEEECFTTDEEVNNVGISAEVCLSSSFSLGDAERKITTKVETRQSMGGCKQRFHTDEHLKVTLNDDVIFEKKWSDIIPRKYV